MRITHLIVAGVLTAATAVAATAQNQHVTATRSVYIHSGPSKSSQQLGVLEQGDSAILLTHRSGYDRVQTTDSTVGWVYARYVQVDSGSAPGPSVTSEGAPAGNIASLAKPEPQEEHSQACADIGKPNTAGSAVDTATNLLKNRIDDGQYQDVSFDDVLKLDWKNLPRKRYQWSADQVKQIAVDEGAAIALVGYLVAVKPEGPEQTNCELPDSTWHDWHMWLVPTAAQAKAKDRTKAVVVEVTPRVRRLDADRFDAAQIHKWISSQQQVRVSGWLLLDPDHPDQVGKTRGTIWEIHPVMKLEAVP